MVNRHIRHKSLTKFWVLRLAPVVISMTFLSRKLTTYYKELRRICNVNLLLTDRHLPNVGAAVAAINGLKRI